ncbi:hypothetical protein E8E12_004849 [Didymella heteroderae]|uniref:Uncharacterized protein n=1 Tax=Didymella heteroderae TaxID=1769908 RepID=A0A9P5C3K6_9PLEO|nr:hypothetical protein E8E12_004849 [Didymella heteroderae]
MPILHAPHASTSSGPSYNDAAARFSFTSKTSRQVIDADNHETRKRRNGDYETSSIRGFTAQPWTGSSSAFSHFESPAPLAHDRYTLAGGSIEGTNSFTRQTGNYDDYFNLQTQRGMWSSPTSPSMQPMTIDRVASTPNAPSSWMVDSLFSLVGGVAGTLFKFCTVPFRGFQAGGGQSYDADAQIKIASKLGLHDEPEPSEPAAPVQQIKFDTRPSPSDDYGIRSIESVDAERPRMPKRLRTEDAWVMVGTDEETTASPVITPRTSERRMPAPSMYTPSPSQIPRPLSRMSATPASKRPSLIPVSRRSGGARTPLYSNSISNSKSNHTRQRSYSRLSFGSPGTPGKPEEKKKISPLPPDSQKLVSRIRREEMEDDARMRRMSSQMSAMLREAREALGSKVEIEDDDDDLMS